jgi:hypothetical protein
MADRNRGERGGRKRERETSRERDRDREERSHARTEAEILAALKNVRQLPPKILDEIHGFARKIDDMRVEDRGRGETKDLFVGNLVDEAASTATLKLLLNAAMQKLGLVESDEHPVLNCRMSNKYCFIEFRSTTDASLAINLTGIPFKGNPLKMGRPAKYGGPTNSIYTWEDLLPYMKGPTAIETGGLVGSTPPPLATKPYREIFIGNTSDRMTDINLRDFIGGAMMKMGLSHSKTENPVYQVRVTGKFAFMEMRTSIDAANVLNLNGIHFLSTPLDIVRTKKYDGGGGIEAYLTWEKLYQSWVEGDLRLMTAGKKTRVLMVTNVTTPEALAANPALYLDIIEDVRLECSQTGMVKSVLVPRTESAGTGSGAKGGLHGPNSPVGKVFIEMETVEQAVNTLMLLKVSTICLL